MLSSSPTPTTSAPTTAPGMLPSPPTTAAANIDSMDAKAGQRIDGGVEADQHAAEARQPHADERDDAADRIGIDALDRSQHGIVGDGAHGLAGAREGEEGEQRRHDGDGDGQVLHLLRPDADAAEAPVARDGQVVAAQLVAEAEAHHVLQRDRQAIEPMAVVMKPAARNGFRTNSSDATPTMPAIKKRGKHRRYDRQAEVHIGDVAGEGADGRMRGEREIGEAQNREDGGQADGGHGEDGPRHDPVDDELQDVHGDRRRFRVRRS